MKFGRECRVIGRFHVFRPETKGLGGFVGRPIEQDSVIPHVEVIVVVDPPGLDLKETGHERLVLGHVISFFFRLTKELPANSDQRPSLACTISFTDFGLALPPVAFMTCPTNQPASFGLLCAFSTCAGLSAMIWSTAASIAPVSLTCFMPRSSTIFSGASPVSM